VRNGWTGGQYSVFRCLLGAYLLVHFARLAPYAAELFSSAGVLPEASLSPLARLFPNVLAFYDPPWLATASCGLGVLASACLAAGLRGRASALVLAYVWACFLGRNPLIANPSIPYVGWMLVAHALLPAAPYGSLDAKGRVDPGGGWRMPAGIFLAAWVALALGYTYSGYTKLVSPSWVDGTAVARVLENPLARPGFLREALRGLPDGVLRALTWGALACELAFAPLALVRRLRPVAWCALLAMHLGLVVLIDFAELSLGMVLVHLFTFDPDWLPARVGARGRVFYDGTCGLCHGFVRFVLAEDRAGSFRFAPLQGETFAAAVPASERARLPDSVVVQTEAGRLLVRSDAVLHVLAGLGGLWRALALVLRLVPATFRDLGYDLVARVRRRVFPKPSDVCPLAPRALAARLDA
jgi:predicted DCC family thiol-disulfide oxidoreductase YuxK